MKIEIQLTKRQLKIILALIALAEGYLYKMNNEVASLFGWDSNPKGVIDEYVKEVTKIKKLFESKQDAK